MKKALVTGITGQDGSYLAELLLSKGYEVHGLLRRSSSFNTQRLDAIYRDPHESGVRFRMHHGDLGDSASLINLIREIEPEEIYHLGAQSHVKVSFEIPEYTANTTGLGTVRILEAVRAARVKTRFYQASSSEMFGAAPPPQNEQTPFHPRSPYGVAKVFGYWITVNYREAYGLFATNGVLFNHESPRRGETFVSRKITRAVARIRAGLQDRLYLGNLEARRDWGYAPEYCINKDVPVLTPEGWRYFDEIDVGDEVINFDPTTSHMRRDKVEHKIDILTEPTRIVLKGRGFFLRCTPGHRIMYQQKSSTSKGGWSHWKVTTASEFKAQLENVSLRRKYDYRLPSVHEYACPDLPGWTDFEVYLVGALLAEGHLRREPAGRGLQVTVSQSFLANETTAKRIDEAIAGLQLSFAPRRQNGGTVEWCFNAESSRRILSWFDSANIHLLPRWCFGLSRRQAAVLFGALMDCDGHWGSMTYVSKRYALAADFQSVALLAGYRTSAVRQRPQAGCFEVCVMSPRKPYAYVREAWLENDGPAEAWCVTTRHGTIITREEDCIAISGNCEAMWLMLQQDAPDDYVIATGESHTVREFVEHAFACVDLDWERYVSIDPGYYRPSEVDDLRGDASKAQRVLGWTPTTRFGDLVKIMVDADVQLLDDQLAGRHINFERD